MSFLGISSIFRVRSNRVVNLCPKRSFRDICGIGRCENCELLRRNVSFKQGDTGLALGVSEAGFTQKRLHSVRVQIKADAEGKVNCQSQAQQAGKQTNILENAKIGQIRELADTFQQLQVLGDKIRTSQSTSKTSPVRKHSEQVESEATDSQLTERETWQKSVDNFSCQMASKKLKIQEARMVKSQERKLKGRSKDEPKAKRLEAAVAVESEENPSRKVAGEAMKTEQSPERDGVGKLRIRIPPGKREPRQQKVGKEGKHVAKSGSSSKLFSEQHSSHFSASIPEFDLEHSDLGEFGSDIVVASPKEHFQQLQTVSPEDNAYSNCLPEDLAGDSATGWITEAPFRFGDTQTTTLPELGSPTPHVESMAEDLQLLQLNTEHIPMPRQRPSRSLAHPGFKHKHAVKGVAKSKSVQDFTWTPDAAGSQTLGELKEQATAAMKVLQMSMRSNAVRMARALHKEQMERKNAPEVAAYVRTCIESGMLKAADSLLAMSSKFHHKPSSRMQPIRDVDVYNDLLHAWAKLGKLPRVKKVLDLMDIAGVKPNFQSHAALLECLGHQTDTSEQLVAQILSLIKEEGLDLAEICNQCQLSRQQWNFVKKAIEQVEPEFVLNPPPPLDKYNCQLLTAPLQQPVENPFCGAVSTEQLAAEVHRQLEMEQMSFTEVPSIEKPVELTAQCRLARQKLEHVYENWQQVLHEGFKMTKHYMARESKGHTGTSLMPYLTLFDSYTYVDLMLEEIKMIIEHMEAVSPAMNTLYTQLGRKINQLYFVHRQQKDGHIDRMGHLYGEYVRKFNAKTLEANHREMWHCTVLENHQGGSLEYVGQEKWPYEVLRKLGQTLYNVILAEAKIDANILKGNANRFVIPALYTVYREEEGTQKLRQEIKPHPALSRLYRQARISDMRFTARELPSLVPPLPWTTHSSGGDLLTTTNLVKFTDNSDAHSALIASLPKNQLYPMLDALNAVSSTPWTVNQPMLDLMIEVFNAGGDGKLKVAPPADSLPPPQRITGEMTYEEQVQAAQRLKDFNKKRKEMYSLWRTDLMRLSIANKYRNKVFWFSHHVDFRGRSYPVPPHFNHLGSDASRSLLKFAKGKPLGAEGLDWLKIHLVNLGGFKKRSSNHERLQFANEQMDKILDSADQPLTGLCWWKSCDEPWQALACCMEIADAVRSPDPTKFESHFPVHQDGSCNGLQHYAALGRDQAGSESVNLAPFDVPSDVYSDVVALVERERLKDAKAGLEIAQVLEGFVKRKVIKQNIMTTVYGVTKYGARAQVARQLEDIEDFPQHMMKEATTYLVDKTFQCLQEMFTSTKQIQEWLVTCADLICMSYKPVSWMTPLGWPVVQPYLKRVPLPTHRQREGKAQDTAKSERALYFEKPNTMKQRNGYPPNFIHSLDACHMMLTAIHCLRAGITFVSVHDCYWTHASDVPTMNKVCREQFVALHKEPILEDLACFMLENFGLSTNLQKNGENLTPESEVTPLSRGNEKPDSRDENQFRLEVANYAKTHGCEAASQKYGVSESSVHCWLQQASSILKEVERDHKPQVKAHNQKELRAEYAKEFVNHVLTSVPERGTFQLENVLDSTYFFS